MDVTRGGLKPATITNTINNDVVKFMFNPYEFTLTKANKWTEDPKVGRNVPKVEFDSGGAVTLKLTLHFDTQDTGADVRAFTDPLWKMMMVADETMNDTTNKSQPPPVEFKYNAIYFKAIITNLSQKFTLFSEKGVPLRCSVDISLKQYADDEASQSQIPGQGPGQGTTPTTTVTEDQRIDHVAGPDKSREVAEKNNIDNPLNVPAGTQLKK